MIDIDREPIETDVLIVGGGIAGLMAAINAVDRGVSVTVAEKANTERSGSGATGNDHFCCYIPEVHGDDIKPIVKEVQNSLVGGYHDTTHTVKFLEQSFARVKDWDNWGISMKPKGNWEFTGHAFPGRPRVWLKYAGHNQKEVLTKQAKRRGVRVENHLPITDIITNGGEVIGAIGLQSLSGAADRNEDFIYVCMDNEAYMNTGIQVSSATPRYTWTATSPTGNTRRKKQIMEIMAAHRMPYAATASIAYPEDLTEKIQKAKRIEGMRFIHMLSPCNTGWKIGDDMAVKVAMMSVETNVFPLYEIEGGLKFTINHHSRNLPVEKYLMLQGRYRHLKKEEIWAIQAETDRTWADLQEKAARKEG